MGTNINTRKFLSRRYSGIYILTGVSYDPDAQAYFNANTAITSTADKNAINTFFLGCKTDGYYTKIKAMYLPLWLSATDNKWNLVNPLDTNAAFRLTFSTGWSFSSTGMKPNGVNAYANTYIIPSVNLINNNTHTLFYSRTNTDGLNFDFGCGLASGQYYDFILKYLNNLYADCYNSSSGRILTTNTNSTGLYINNRTASNVFKIFKNGSQLGATNTGASTGFTSLTMVITISALNENGIRLYYSPRENCFFSCGEGLTDTQATNFSNRINTLMTYFGINTY
ncbi:MAG: hypothetical protein EBR30_21090 [Cytophagia bacterium]|nr:hypothetical protein [Pseudomonadota bacterium]NBW37463.1 hypothetical protein [Cytophagia bacterium]